MVASVLDSVALSAEIAAEEALSVAASSGYMSR